MLQNPSLEIKTSDDTAKYFTSQKEEFQGKKTVKSGNWGSSYYSLHKLYPIACCMKSLASITNPQMAHINIWREGSLTKQIIPVLVKVQQASKNLNITMNCNFFQNEGSI